MTDNKWVVKSRETGSIRYVGNQDVSDDLASALNRDYQTDEWFTEPYDYDKVSSVYSFTAHHIHLGNVLGPTAFRALLGPDDGERPIRVKVGYEIWHMIERAEGADAARAWFIGGKPMLDNDTPIEAIRKGHYSKVHIAAIAYIDNDGGDW